MKPPIYHIDANNSGAWKRVLRDVKAATLPEVLRAIDWLSAACPGTSWRVVDATTERTLDRSALDASGHTEWAARHVHQGAPAVAER
jgi:hypothetical protein